MLLSTMIVFTYGSEQQTLVLIPLFKNYHWEFPTWDDTIFYKFLLTLISLLIRENLSSRSKIDWVGEQEGSLQKHNKILTEWRISILSNKRKLIEPLMDQVYHLLQKRNSYETDPFIDIHDSNAALQNLVDIFRSRCEVLEREFVERVRHDIAFPFLSIQISFGMCSTTFFIHHHDRM